MVAGPKLLAKSLPVPQKAKDKMVQKMSVNNKTVRLRARIKRIPQYLIRH